LIFSAKIDSLEGLQLTMHKALMTGWLTYSYVQSYAVLKRIHLS